MYSLNLIRKGEKMNITPTNNNQPKFGMRGMSLNDAPEGAFKLFDSISENLSKIGDSKTDVLITAPRNGVDGVASAYRSLDPFYSSSAIHSMRIKELPTTEQGYQELFEVLDQGVTKKALEAYEELAFKIRNVFNHNKPFQDS